jgi:hypothetical protein
MAVGKPVGILMAFNDKKRDYLVPDFLICLDVGHKSPRYSVSRNLAEHMYRIAPFMKFRLDWDGLHWPSCSTCSPLETAKIVQN